MSGALAKSRSRSFSSAETSPFTQCAAIVAALGEYPGAMVDLAGILSRTPVGTDGVPSSSGPKKQGTRMIKLVCEISDCECGGYTVRTTRRWIETGLPLCPVGHQMMEA